MKKQILLIQGGGEGAYEEDKLLAESLRNKFAACYDVRYPRMPEENGSTYGQWKERLAKDATLNRDKGIILAAHSSGGSLLFKYLTEENIKANFRGLFMVAAPYFGARNWGFKD